MAQEAFYTQGGNYTAQEDRNFLATLHYAPSTGPGGVIAGLQVVQGGGSTVKVKAGCSFVFDGNGGAYQGALLADTAAITITPASGSARTDTVYQIIQDPGSGATAGEPAYLVAVGTTSIPALAVPLARVTANVGGTLTITDVRVQAEPAALHAADTGWYALGASLVNGWTTLTALGYSQPTVRARGKSCWLRADLGEPLVGYRGTYGGEAALVLPSQYIPLYTVKVPTFTTAPPGAGEVGSPNGYAYLVGTNNEGSGHPPGTLVFSMPSAVGQSGVSVFMSYVLE